MTFAADPAEEIAERQAEIARLLLHQLHTPLPGNRFVRGVLPAPTGAAVRVITGDRGTYGAGGAVMWEIPLTGGDPEDQLGGGEILGVLRALHAGTHISSSSRVDTVMGMPLVRVDLAEVDTVRPGPDEDAFDLLTALVCPWTEEGAALRLRGFRLAGPDRVRLYLDREEAPEEVVAADVRPSGARTALLAALPSLITEPERGAVDEGDPHGVRAIDLTDW